MRFSKKRSIKSILVLFSFLLILPLGISILMLYQKTDYLLMKTASDYSSQIIAYTSENIQDYVQELATSVYPLASNSATIDFLNQEDDTSAFLNYRYRLELQKFVEDSFVLQRNDIFAITIACGEEQVFSTRSQLYALASLKEYGEKLSGPGSFQILGIRQIDNTQVLTFGLEFYPKGFSLRTATILVDVYLSSFCRTLRADQAGSGFFWMLNRDGQILYHPNTLLIGTYIDPEQEAKIFTPEDYQLKKEETDYIMVSHYTEPGGHWKLIYETPINEVGTDLSELQTSLWIAGAAFLLFAIAVLSFFSYIYTKPIFELKTAMEHASSGDLNIQVPEQPLTEFASLADGFNTMVQKLDKLIADNQRAQYKEQEMEITIRESMLQFMQSTINPHFLYNTLEIINSYAILENNLEISRMARNLAAFFRYSISSTQNSVSLADEIKHTLTYLEIQKERFETLQVETNLNEANSGNIPAVRLMVQPLVENSFRHGYDAHLLAPSYIGIFGREEETHYVVSVCDHGGGMKPEQAAEFEKIFSSLSDDTLETNAQIMQRMQHIGLWNVHYRMRLTFGVPYGLHIVSSGQDGTVMEIILPKGGLQEHGKL